MTPRPTAMLCTSNGVGLGHLSRVMAIAQHLAADFDVVIFTLSAAVTIPVSQGFRTEYLRSHEYSEFDGRQWNSLLEQRLEHLHDLYQPSVVLYDGTHPYAGLCRYLDRHSDVARVWERRGMWRPGEGTSALLRSRHFDLIVEPGDYAASYDHGATAGARSGAERFAPVIYRGTPLDQEAARARLELVGDVPAALVQLGAGQINDVSSLIRHAVDLLTAAGVHVVVAASVLADRPDIDVPGVSFVQEYPISDLFAAFDMGMFAGGYNSFHEALALQLPSIFAPNLHTKLDDQSARTRYAHDHGLGFDWSDGTVGSLDSLVSRLLDPAEREAIRHAAAKLPDACGAKEIAERLRGLAVGV